VRGSPDGQDAAHDAAERHAAGCSRCQARLEVFAEAILSDQDALPCAECQARLHDYVELELASEGAASTMPEVARHLAACGACAESQRALLETVRLLASGDLPAPPRWPAFDTAFTRRVAAPAAVPPPVRPTAERWSDRRRQWVADLRGAWARLTAAPRRPPRREPLVSLGVLGPALALVGVVVVVAWTAMHAGRPEVPEAADRQTAEARQDAARAATAAAAATGGVRPTALRTAEPRPIRGAGTAAPVPAVTTTAPEVSPAVAPTNPPERERPRRRPGATPVSGTPQQVTPEEGYPPPPPVYPGSDTAYPGPTVEGGEPTTEVPIETARPDETLTPAVPTEAATPVDTPGGS